MGRRTQPQRKKAYREVLVKFFIDDKLCIRPTKEVKSGVLEVGQECTFDLPGHEKDPKQKNLLRGY